MRTQEKRIVINVDHKKVDTKKRLWGEATDTKNQIPTEEHPRKRLLTLKYQ